MIFMNNSSNLAKKINTCIPNWSTMSSKWNNLTPSKTSTSTNTNDLNPKIHVIRHQISSSCPSGMSLPPKSIFSKMIIHTAWENLHPFINQIIMMSAPWCTKLEIAFASSSRKSPEQIRSYPVLHPKSTIKNKFLPN